MSSPPTDRRGAVAVFALAFAVRALVVPRWGLLSHARGLRRAFDGHERAYLRAFQGEGLADASPAFQPVLGALYAALGSIVAHPGALVVFSAAVGAAAAVGVATWTGRRFGVGAGRWAGLLVALLPEHAAWSTSAYPVILPHALLVGAFVARRSGFAALCAFAAAALRPELAALALLRGAPGLAGLAGAAVWLAMAGSAPIDGSLAHLTTVLRVNLSLVGFLGPAVLGLAALGLVDRRAWPIAGAVALNHALAAGFDDQGARHVLFGAVGLCALAGVAAARWGWAIGGVVAVGLAVQTRDLAQVWATPADLRPLAASLPPPSPGCLVVTDEPVLSGQEEPSHLLLWSAPPPPDACVLWGEEGAHRAWSSRGLRDRARRMRAHYDPVPTAAAPVPGGWRVYHRLTLPRTR